MDEFLSTLTPEKKKQQFTPGGKSMNIPDENIGNHFGFVNTCQVQKGSETGLDSTSLKGTSL
jgi:hypothetical protein